jgi:hypothetical protein
MYSSIVIFRTWLYAVIVTGLVVSHYAPDSLFLNLTSLGLIRKLEFFNLVQVGWCHQQEEQHVLLELHKLFRLRRYEYSTVEKPRKTWWRTTVNLEKVSIVC